MVRHLTFISVLLVVMLICFDLLADIPFQISAKQYARIAEEYGDSAVDRVKSWQEIIAESSNLDEDEKLYEINRFFNQLAFVDDIEHWGKEDYWATPIEFLATDAGDCEDFTIAKYYSLRALGIPEEKMRLMYVKALRLNQAHMVLAYFSSPDAVPLILDNLNPRIMPAHRRTDLLPVYSFNGEGLWLAKAQGRGRQVQSGGNNSLWADLTERIEQGR